MTLVYFVLNSCFSSSIFKAISFKCPFFLDCKSLSSDFDAYLK